MSLMRILCMLPAARGVYPPEAEERRLNLMRSYTTPATQVDVESARRRMKPATVITHRVGTARVA